MNKLMLRYTACCLILVGLTVCSDSIIESTPSIDENKEPIIAAPTFTNIQENILNKSCAFSGCHSAGSVNPNLSDNAFQNIVNKQSSTGTNYITPNDPANSYLLQKVIGASGINGSRMPLNNSALSQENIDAITEWINDGAKDN